MTTRATRLVALEGLTDCTVMPAPKFTRLLFVNAVLIPVIVTSTACPCRPNTGAMPAMIGGAGGGAVPVPGPIVPVITASDWNVGETGGFT